MGGLNQSGIFAPVGMESYGGGGGAVFVDLLQYQKDQARGLAATYAAAAGSVTNGGNGSFTGAFAGSGAGLTNLPALPSELFACSHTPAGITNSAQPRTVYSVTIPGNALGRNGTLRASCLLSANGSAGVEVRYYYGNIYGNTLMACFTGSLGYRLLFGVREIANRNAPDSQISLPTGSPAVYGSSPVAPAACQAFDTSKDFTFSIALFPSGSTGTNTLEDGGCRTAAPRLDNWKSSSIFGGGSARVLPDTAP